MNSVIVVRCFMLSGYLRHSCYLHPFGVPLKSPMNTYRSQMDLKAIPLRSPIDLKLIQKQSHYDHLSSTTVSSRLIKSDNQRPRPIDHLKLFRCFMQSGYFSPFGVPLKSPMITYRSQIDPKAIPLRSPIITDHLIKAH